MTLQIKADVTMQERLAEFDSAGTLASDAAAIFALLPDQGEAAAQAFSMPIWRILRCGPY